MRPTLLAAVALVAAIVGGASALGLADATGLGSGGQVTTVYVPTPQAAGAVLPAALPALGNGFDPAAIYARRSAGVVTIYADLGSAGGAQGSGFVTDARGMILTNAHVITNVAEVGPTQTTAVHAARAVVVEFKDGDRVPAHIVGWDRFSDVGVVKVDPAAHRLAPVPLGDSSRVAVGDPVAAIGSPFGNQSSLSVGVVSATGRAIDSLTSSYAVADAIQIDAPINRGNSGGPLFDARGRVIGVNAQIRSTSGASEGVGFAIPIDIARRALAQLVATGKVAYAYVGVTTRDVTPGLARRLGLSVQRGALVERVEPGGPAARAGLRGGRGTVDYAGLGVTPGGDVIVRLGQREIHTAEDVSRVVSQELVPGQAVRVVVVRGTQRLTLVVKLVERPLVPGS